MKLNSTMNNFIQIRRNLNFEDDKFYMIQILTRKKDNPYQNRHVKIIKDFYIDSIESYNLAKPKIIQLCEDNNARAYINLNRRSYNKVAFEMAKQLLDLIQTNQASVAKNLFTKVAGKFHGESRETKSWVVDIDTKQESVLNKIVVTIVELHKETKKDYSRIFDIIPTPNGYHIIASPFNVQEFTKIHPKIDIHKDNPTILYTPDYEME